MLKRWMIVLGLLTLSIGGLWLAMPEPQKAIREGDPAASFTLPDLNGRAQSLPQGKVILLNFWATWCPPCRQEMPSMAELQRKYSNRNFEVVAVSVDRDPAALAGFVREYNLPFTVLNDATNEVSHAWGVFRYPETFLIDQNGVVRVHQVGAIDWMAPTVSGVIESLLAAPPQSAAAVNVGG